MKTAATPHSISCHSVSFRHLRWIVTVLAGALLLSACGPSDEEKAAAVQAEATARTAAKARSEKQAAAADPTNNMAHAVVVGKSQAVLELKYDIAKNPIAGEPIEIELAFVPLYEGDSIHAVIAPATVGLTIDGNLTPSTNAVKAGTPWRINLVMHAAAASAYYFTVAVDHNAAGVRSTRNFAIPILVSASASAASTTTTDAHAGDKKATS